MGIAVEIARLSAGLGATEDAVHIPDVAIVDIEAAGTAVVAQGIHSLLVLAPTHAAKEALGCVIETLPSYTKATAFL